MSGQVTKIHELSFSIFIFYVGRIKLEIWVNHYNTTMHLTIIDVRSEDFDNFVNETEDNKPRYYRVQLEIFNLFKKFLDFF